MFSTIELYRAIRERLESAFPKTLIQQKDIKNITRPSFYIQYVGKNFDKIAQDYSEDRISFNIIYFAENESLLELLEIEEAFTIAFNTPLTVADGENTAEVEKDSIQSNLNEEDYYLNLTVDFALTQKSIRAEDTTGDNMDFIGVEIDNENNQKMDEYDEGLLNTEEEPEEEPEEDEENEYDT